MSSCNRRRFLLALAAGPALAGCGFAPAYGPGGSANALQGAVLVETPDSRETYLLTRQIEDRLGRAPAAKYGLSYSLTFTEERMAISATNITSRFNVVGKVTYALRDLTSDEVLTTGTVNSFTGYSTTGSTVATLAAQRSAHERLAVILADQIVTRLIAHSPNLPQ